MHDKNLGQVQRGRCYGDRRLPGRSAVSDLLSSILRRWDETIESAEKNQDCV